MRKTNRSLCKVISFVAIFADVNRNKRATNFFFMTTWENKGTRLPFEQQQQQLWYMWTQKVLSQSKENIPLTFVKYAPGSTWPPTFSPLLIFSQSSYCFKYQRRKEKDDIKRYFFYYYSVYWESCVRGSTFSIWEYVAQFVKVTFISLITPKNQK